MFKSIVLLVLCAYAVAAKEIVRNKRSSQLIVGGSNAGKGKYPEFAILYYDGEFSCGGTILNRDSILTAAHCIFEDAALYTVAVGKYNMKRDQGTEEYLEVEDITVHPDYSLPDNDIAILHLKTRMTYTDFIQPVTLAKNAKSENFTTCYAIGVGSSEQTDDGPEYPNVVQELLTDVISRKRCKRIIERELGFRPGTISKKHICTFDDDAGVCFGDSGGPVGCFDADNTFVQMGLLSFGSPVCVDGFNVFTRVSQYKAWIKENS